MPIKKPKGKELTEEEKKAAADSANASVQQWEELMWKFQQPLPWARPGEKWVVMEQIFSLPHE